jgi:hypothetical protein
MKRMPFLWLGWLIGLIGCSSKATNPLQQPERFAEVYANVLIALEVDADSTSLSVKSTPTLSARADSVLRSLGIEPRQFEAAVKYFSEDPERWRKVYKHLVKILEDQASSGTTRD